MKAFKASILLLGILFLGSTGFGAEPSSEIPELTALRAERDAKLAPFREKWNNALQARKDRYLKDLLSLEADFSNAGKKAETEVVRKEREIYGKGEEGVGFDPKDKTVPSALMQLRLNFERDLATTRVSLSSEPRSICANYIRQLDALERGFTTQKNTAGVEAVQAEREIASLTANDPLKTYIRNPAGVWKWSNGEERTFTKDGKWSSNKGRQGSWEWTDEAKGKFVLNESKRSRSIMKIESDGLKMSGGERGGGGGGIHVGLRVR